MSSRLSRRTPKPDHFLQAAHSSLAPLPSFTNPRQCGVALLYPLSTFTPMPAPVSSDLKHEVSTLLAQKQYPALKQKLAPALAQDFAPILADLPLADLAVLFRYCSKELAVAIFS